MAIYLFYSYLSLFRGFWFFFFFFFFFLLRREAQSMAILRNESVTTDFSCSFRTRSRSATMRLTTSVFRKSDSWCEQANRIHSDAQYSAGPHPG